MWRVECVFSAAMNELLLTGGRVIDPANHLDKTADLLIRDGKIAAVGPNAPAQAAPSAERMDVAGLVVAPGLIDMHVHLREPGQTAKETMATGTAAAARGGFTSVVCMPNTSPAIDNSGTVALIQNLAEAHGVVNVLIAGAITKNIAGEELAPIGSLRKAGVVAITDDGHCIQNNEVMRRALEYAKMFDLPVLDHCQDYSLVTEGVMHEGYWSTALGLRGWPSAGEQMMVARNVLLAETTGAHVHCQHISAAGSVALLRDARKRGVRISAEACPHHFTLTDAAVAGSDKFWHADGKGIAGFDSASADLPVWPPYDTHFKMNPPLGSAADRKAILEGLADGTIDVLCSDHAPHCSYEKEVEFDYAPFGITGLETELALSLMQLYHAGRLSLNDVLAKYTVAPARLLHLAKGTLSPGADGDITIINPELGWVFDKATTASKSLNSPFYGWRLKGKAVGAIVGGKKVWMEQSVSART
jgi:dihydroorotase